MVVLLAAAAAAQDAPAPRVPPEALAPAQRWTLQFEPSVWYSSPGGQLALPGAPAGTETVYLDVLNLDSPRASPAGELHLYSEDWTLSLSGFRTELENRGFVASSAFDIGGVSLLPGERAFASMTFTSVDALVSRRVALPPSLAGEPGGGFAARLDLKGGARLMDVGFDLSAPGGGQSYHGFYLQPVIGAKLTMDLTPRFTIDLQLDAGAFPGGGRESWSYDIIAGFMYRPTDNLAVQIGYRDLAYELREGSSDDRFLYRGALQGLYAGAVLRF